MKEAIEFPFLIPPDWCEKMKCPSQERYIAFYWSAKNDEIAWNDGKEEGIHGKEVRNAWMAYMRQSQIEHFLCSQHVHFGFCDIAATHWLLFDTVGRKAYIIPVKIVGDVLKTQSLCNVIIRTRVDQRQLNQFENQYI